MDFTLSEEQKLIQQTAHKFAVNELVTFKNVYMVTV